MGEQPDVNSKEHNERATNKGENLKMKKTELEALGLNREQIRAVQQIHGKGIMQERNKPDSKSRNTISAIVALLRLLPAEALHELLVHANTLYIQQEPPAGTQVTEMPGNED